MPATYDLLLQGGTVVDPAQGLHAARDVAIHGERIAAIQPHIAASAAAQVVDARGLIVTPGLIDLHVHVWHGVSHFGIEPDPHLVARGVTTAFDAGSAGADTFPGFKKFVIDVSATRLKAFLHVSSQGMLSPDVGELEEIRFADVRRAVQMCATYKQDIVGIKIRMGREMVGANGSEAWKRARAVCEATGLPLMVHPNNSPLSMAAMLAQLKRGDIVTHCFHQSDTGVLDADGRVRPEVRQAIERGILFDVGHGAGSFVFRVAEAALAQGLTPGTISTDLHIYNVHGPVYDTATTVSKFLHLGLSLDEAIARVTAAPAQAMGLLPEIGTLRPGSWADVALFRLATGAFPFRDVTGDERTGERKLEPVTTIRAGKVYAPGGAAHPHPHPH